MKTLIITMDSVTNGVTASQRIVGVKQWRLIGVFAQIDAPASPAALQVDLFQGNQRIGFGFGAQIGIGEADFVSMAINAPPQRNGTASIQTAPLPDLEIQNDGRIDVYDIFGAATVNEIVLILEVIEKRGI